MPKPLADIVLEEGLATAADVERAAVAAERDRTPLVVALVREGGVDEVALVAALRRHLRISLADPATVAADPEAVRELTRDVCRRLRVAPLAISSYGRSRVLQVAMADPTDLAVLAEIEQESGCQIEPVLMTVSAVEELAEKTYHHFVTEVMHRDTAVPSTTSTKGKVLADAAPSAGGGRTAEGPTTIPYHRISEEADLATRLEAISRLLIDKGILSEDELEEAVRQALRRREEGT